jgi:hypothetical protein
VGSVVVNVVDGPLAHLRVQQILTALFTEADCLSSGPAESDERADAVLILRVSATALLSGSATNADADAVSLSVAVD